MPDTELQTTQAQEARQTRPAGVYAPRVDVVETQDDLLLYADLPGVRTEDVTLSCKGDQLVLHARCAPRRHGTAALHAEYGVGDFHRTFTVTEQVDTAGIEASLKDGVLTVRLPKTEAVRPRRIRVRGADTGSG